MIRRSVERRLKEFVDRDAQVEAFVSLITTDEKSLMAIWGGGGSGKSSLIARMIVECGKRDTLHALVEWGDEWRNDYLQVMREIRDQLGAQHFGAFTDLINFFTSPGYRLTVAIEGAEHISVLNHANIGESTTGDIAGVMVKDLQLVLPRQDLDVSPTERMTRLTNAFVASLAAATQVNRAVIFFDAAEKMPAETREWFWGPVLRAVDENRLPNVRFVLSGRERPQASRDLAFMIAESEIEPLGVDHIVEYLGRRGVPDDQRISLAHMLRAAAGGNALQIATLTDVFLESYRT